jgi:hypothetical protein
MGKNSDRRLRPLCPHTPANCGFYASLTCKHIIVHDDKRHTQGGKKKLETSGAAFSVLKGITKAIRFALESSPGQSERANRRRVRSPETHKLLNYDEA